MSAMEWSQAAILANLSYVRWTIDNTLSAQGIVNAAVAAERVSKTLGSDLFVEGGWTIPSYHPNDESGFAANIFQNNVETVLAIRGTEANLIEALPFVGDTGLQDLIRTDLIDIGIAGFALEQTVSLANYVMRLQAGTSDNGVAQISLHSKVVLWGQDPGVALPHIKISSGVGPIGTDTYFWLEAGQPTTGLGILDDGGVTVTGHSLGGHLAVLAIRLFPDLFEEAVTFNAPGFDPITSFALTDQFVALIGQALGITPAATFGDVAGRVTAIESEGSAPGDDPSLVASLVTGIPVGEEVQIHTEKNSHSMDQLMDDLAVHSLIARLNPALELGQLHRFYDSAASNAGSTDETILQSLARVILGEEPILDHVDAGLVSHGDFGRRSTIHDLVVDLTAAIEAMELTLEPLWELSAPELADLALNAVEYRVALTFLDPFIIRGNEALYSNPADEVGVIFDSQSADYWLARSQMLLALLDHGLADGSHDGSQQDFITYVDELSGNEFVAIKPQDGDATHVFFGGVAESGTLELSGTDGDDALFGGAGMDSLQGGMGVDRLDGGGGADFLIGGGGAGWQDDIAADVLVGGYGADTYIAGNGDIILDSDRRVIDIVLNGFSMAQTYNLTGDGVYQTEDGTRTLEIVGSDAHLSVVDVAASATIVIRDFLPLGMPFVDGDFGISLVGPGEDTGPGMSFSIVGTEQDDHPWNPHPDAEHLLGTDGNNGIAGLGGNDYIISLAGADIVDGGPGDDFIHNLPLAPGFLDTDGDLFLGGSGDDVLAGNGGDDWLIGSDGSDVIQAASGDDLLEGGGGDDLIFGGYGTDAIYGGAGDDRILADEPSHEVSASDWAAAGGDVSALDVFDADPAEVPGNLGQSGNDNVWGGPGRDSLDGGGGDDVLFGEWGGDGLNGGHGDDVLEGGHGDDSLRGGYGADRLYGGEHMDSLFGGEGDDVLDGGDSDDRLRGDYGDDLLLGGAGSDRYYFEEYEGWDVIMEVAGNPFDRNSMFMPMGQSAQDYLVSRSGNDLVIAHVYEESGIVLEGWFSGTFHMDVRFDDAVWNASDLDALAIGQGSRWDDFVYGGDHGVTLFGREGDDVILGGTGDDMIHAGVGDDALVGGEGDDVLDGGAGGDEVIGGEGDDVLIAGGTGAAFAVDSMWGGNGSDVYVASGQPGATMYVVDFGANPDDQDVMVLPDSITPDDVMIRRLVEGSVTTTALELRYPDSTGSGFASVAIFDWFGAGAGRIESFEFASGDVLSAADMDGRIGRATSASDYLVGSGDEVVLHGYGGDDELVANGAGNVLRGGAGDDHLTGAGASNHLVGGAGDDVLHARAVQDAHASTGAGTAILNGGSGQDNITLITPNADANSGFAAFIDGGEDRDSLVVEGSGIAIIAGGDGFDFIEVASAHVVMLLNSGDDGDVITSTTDWGRAGGASPEELAGSTISFGNGIVPEDVSLTRDARDLLVNTGMREGVRLVGYFDDEGQPADWLAQLQFVMQATATFVPDGAGQSGDSPVLVLDVAPLLDEFVAADLPPGTAWTIGDSESSSNALHLDDEAIGGQVAYEYALVGSGAGAGSVGDLAALLGAVTVPDSPVEITQLTTWPVTAIDLQSIQALEGSAFQFQLPSGWIMDPLSGESLVPELAGVLPDWLSYDAASGALSGVPGAPDVGTDVITFVATSALGQSGSFAFNIDIEGRPVESGVVLTGNDGRDNLTGTIGADQIFGGKGADRIDGGAGADQIDGGDGGDKVRGGAGDDTISGGLGTDELRGEQGDDHISGGPGRDRISGAEGNDTLSGEGGNDTVFGGDGDDIILYGTGTDRFDGGAGDDTYVITSWTGKVSMRDSSGTDTLDFSNVAAAEEVRFTRQGDNLIVSPLGRGSRIAIHGWYRDSDARIENLVFSDGAILSEHDVLDLVQQRVSAWHPRGGSGPELLRTARLESVDWDALAAQGEWSGAGHELSAPT